MAELKLRQMCPAFKIVHKNLANKIGLKIQKHSKKDWWSKNSKSLVANPHCSPQVKQTLRFLG